MRTRVKIVVWVVGIIVAPIGIYVGACLLGGSSLPETVLFLGRFIAQPHSVGAVAPSSKKLAVGLCKYIRAHSGDQVRHILEVGPGTGAVTNEIVARLQPHDQLDIVELDDQMATALEKKYAQHPQVRVVSGSITDWHPAYKYERVVVGIPFNALPFSLVQHIWDHITHLIAERGILSYFAYIGLPYLKKAFLPPAEKKDFKNIQRYLKDSYRKKGIGKKIIWSNVPPALIRYLQFS